MRPIQQHIINTLNVQPTIDPATEYRIRVNFLKNFIRNTNIKGFVLGISGGQDSALAGYIAQTAVKELRTETGKDFTFIAMLLPYGKQKDSADAQIIAREFIKADRVETFNILETVNAFTNSYNTQLQEKLTDYHKGNVKARIRAVTQYAVAGMEGLLVVGTDHAAEAVSGFFTKFGDGAADILPLSGLNKRQGKQLLRYLNAPEFVITKAPTADLLDLNQQQADETELGITYDVLDDYLEGKEVPVADAEKIEARYLATEHKRHQPVGPGDIW